ncbi:MAG: 3-deoxy-manno-octulosonate cytidylyltransferase [Syntrophobacterales bacterium]|jgi:3-deoxy-manno-octulosonate cytidylyltransferase (CMP-KDO synthetase)|nr:3-deoxy-manno-octulosonate cytidylyltransferase [Syntrophobacterales bacterium]
MKKLVVIPARYASARLPGKPLRTIAGKPLIQWVYEKAISSSADNILVATDDERIQETCASFGAEAVMTDPSLRSGTDRVYEAISGKKGDLIVNLQGDEPFIEPSMIDTLFRIMEEDVPMATLCTPISREEYENPNTVKVVLDKSHYALYFSRSPIPYIREALEVPLYGHIGIYGFSRSFLSLFVAMEKGLLEEAESLEQLRVLENGVRIKVAPVHYTGFGIDTEEDLKKAEERMAKD